MPPAPSSTARASRPGRPPRAKRRDVRVALLDSARALFLQYGYRAVSSRQIARRTGVDPAMVQYYFGSKRALYVAVLESTAAPMRALLEEMLGQRAATDPARFVDLYMRLMAANPWIPALIVREVLTAPAAFREPYLASFVQPMAARVRRVVERGQADGTLDPASPPGLVLLSLMSLCMWPFIVRPVLKRVLGIDLDGPGLEAVVAHTVRTVMRVLGPPAGVS